MSLTKFVQRPAIRDAFQMLATRSPGVASTVGTRIMVPRGKTHPSAIGTAFDYLARFSMARRLRGVRVKVCELAWIAEDSLHILPMVCGTAAAIVWHRRIKQARCVIEAYVAGAARSEELGEAAQILAHCDLLLRFPLHFKPKFAPKVDATTELFALLDLFESTDALMKPERFCALNPSFVMSRLVGGADADIVIDRRLIELKVVGTLAPRTHLLQLAGYAALHHIGGLVTPYGIHQERFSSIEIYYARHGKLVRWNIADLFEASAFHRFCAVFKSEMEGSRIAVQGIAPRTPEGSFRTRLAGPPSI